MALPRISMTRIIVTATAIATLYVGAHAADPFAQPLARDKQAAHVLNRLAYGPRPGDVEAVRPLGAEAWIRKQLHPGRVLQSAALETRLRALVSVQLPTWELFERYQQPPAGLSARPPLEQLLRAEQVAKVQSGTPDERRAILGTLTGDRRTQVLLVLPPAAMNGLQDVQVEAFNVRQAETERQRKLRPPLMDLITQEQIETLLRGTDAAKTALLTALDAEKRSHVLRQVPPLAMPAAFRREAMKLGQSGQLPLVELIDAKVYRALYSTRQLEEVLVDFWLNHFNVFSGKGPVRMLLTSYERDAIRPHVFGRFRDMVLATARHPAMLFYLDNWQSQAPRTDSSPQPATAEPQRPTGLNENYGRELMELHTLGVDGGYTQADVVNVARSFSGWTIHEPTRYGEFYFNPAMHDRGEKVVLGHTIPRGGGEQDGLMVVDILSRHQSTAKFVARKLAQRFVADTPPQALVDRVAAVFVKTDGNLRAVTEALLLSREFMSEGAWQSKLKSPFELAMSALRAVDADVTDTIALAQRIGELGQPLYGKSEPTGYANTSEPWASSASIVGRINFAAALVSGQIAGVAVDPRRWPTDRRQLAAQILSADTPSSLPAAATHDSHTPAGAELAAVLLASPAFQKR
jgi:uncharacterized protein (DUF1800 family)